MDLPQSFPRLFQAPVNVNMVGATSDRNTPFAHADIRAPSIKKAQPAAQVMGSMCLTGNGRRHLARRCRDLR